MDNETGALIVLAENLLLGEGIDISLLPNTELRIKVYCNCMMYTGVKIMLLNNY